MEIIVLKVMLKASMSRVNGGLIFTATNKPLLPKELQTHIDAIKNKSPIYNKYTHINEETAQATTYSWSYIDKCFEVVDCWKMTCCGLTAHQDAFDSLTLGDMKKHRATRFTRDYRYFNGIVSEFNGYNFD